MNNIINDLVVNENYQVNNIYTKGLLLLALTVMGNFVAETLGCSTQRLLNKSRIAKLSVIFFLIYFTINLTAGIDGVITNPITQLIAACALWLLFIIFTKTTTFSKQIIFISLCLHYILGNFNAYYEQNNINDYDTLISILDKSLLFIIAITTIIGFINYFIKEKREHKRFSWYKFFIGVDKCKNI